jgi:hypothetical protein
MRLERLFHLFSTGLEDTEQISVTTFKSCEHVAQLLRRCFGIKPKYPADDIVRSNFIG